MCKMLLFQKGDKYFPSSFDLQKLTHFRTHLGKRRKINMLGRSKSKTHTLSYKVLHRVKFCYFYSKQAIHRKKNSELGKKTEETENEKRQIIILH